MNLQVKHIFVALKSRFEIESNSNSAVSLHMRPLIREMVEFTEFLCTLST